MNAWLAAGAAALALSGTVQAQGVPPVGVTDQKSLLASPDPELAANKKLVFDMWRAVIQGGHTELAPQYFTEGYIQHNPNVATGRDAMVEYMKHSRPVVPIEPEIHFPVVAIVAEGDLVLVATVSTGDDPDSPGTKYLGTHFDLFRIEHGKIAEHWDSVPKSKAMLHFNPNIEANPNAPAK
jgi:predicted SnoaL-like aldol condensation-catalyzing enzyme